MSEVDRARRARERGDGRTWRERALAAEAEVKRLKKITGKYSVYDALKAAEAERDRLADALRSIDVGFALTAAEMRDRARAALAGENT